LLDCSQEFVGLQPRLAWRRDSRVSFPSNARVDEARGSAGTALCAFPSEVGTIHEDRAMMSSEPNRRMRGESIRRNALASTFIMRLAVAVPGWSEERRINFPDGHAVVDDDSGRVEFYGSDGRLKSWGRVDGTGSRTDFFLPDGTPAGHATKNPVSGRWDMYDA